jgi:hypothetical protein
VAFGVLASRPPSVSVTVEAVEVAEPYARPAANPRTLWSEPLVAPLSAKTAETVGQEYTCASLAIVCAYAFACVPA